MILNILERHTRLKGKMGWPQDLAVILGFVLFACFQAWHDQYSRAEALIEQSHGVAPLSGHNVEDAQKVLASAPTGSRVQLYTSGYNPQVSAVATTIRDLFMTNKSRWHLTGPGSLTGTPVVGMSDGPQYAGLTCGFRHGNLEAFKIAVKGLAAAGFLCPEVPGNTPDAPEAHIYITVAVRSTPDR